VFEPPVRIEDRARRQRIVFIVAVILLVSAALRLYQLADPAEFMFDEVYYAKDAKAIVDGRVGTDGPLPWEAGDEVSWPHPEMGKFAIAVGILVFGDRAFGWRIPAVIAGMAMLALVYPLARRLGLPPPWALIALGLAAADPLGIAQSRIATLDVFVGAWTVLCIYLGLRYVQDGRDRRMLVLSALAGGMAVGTKWSGALALVVVGVILVIVWARDYRAERRATKTGAPGTSAGGASPAGGGEDRASSGPLAAPSFGRSLRRALPSALIATGILVLVPASVWFVSYAQYFLAGHTWSQFVELQRQALYFNRNLKTEHTYASPSYSWIIDYRPVWYYFKGGHVYRGVIAIGNPFLWWLATLGLLLAVVLAVLRRSLLLLPAALIVVLLYLPWFAASRTSFLYYMAPVAPFMAILVAGLLLLYAGQVRLPRRGVWVLAAAGVATALLWDYAGRAAALLFWTLPGRVSPTLSWVGVGIGILLALLVVIALFAPRLRSWRPTLAMVLAGVTIGICVAFLPIVLNIPISIDHFHHIMWFRNWI
jgi:dolichyl-phosphate-mannose--protein O-mannosyl transferase